VGGRVGVGEGQHPPSISPLAVFIRQSPCRYCLYMRACRGHGANVKYNEVDSMSAANTNNGTQSSAAGGTSAMETGSHPASGSSTAANTSAPPTGFSGLGPEHASGFTNEGRWVKLGQPVTASTSSCRRILPVATPLTVPAGRDGSRPENETDEGVADV
jgi:hypothetical protein